MQVSSPNQFVEGQKRNFANCRACALWVLWTTFCPLAVAAAGLHSLICGQTTTSRSSQRPYPAHRVHQLAMLQLHTHPRTHLHTCPHGMMTRMMMMVTFLLAMMMTFKRKVMMMMMTTTVSMMMMMMLPLSVVQMRQF